jgi:hypothetical protein
VIVRLDAKTEDSVIYCRAHVHVCIVAGVASCARHRMNTRKIHHLKLTCNPGE